MHSAILFRKHPFYMVRCVCFLPQRQSRGISSSKLYETCVRSNIYSVSVTYWAAIFSWLCQYHLFLPLSKKPKVHFPRPSSQPAATRHPPSIAMTKTKGRTETSESHGLLQVIIRVSNLLDITKT